MKTAKSIKERMEQHPVPYIFGSILIAFTSGIGASEWRRAPDIEELVRYRALGASPEQLKGKLAAIEGPAPIKSSNQSSLNNSSTDAITADASRKLEEIRQKHSVRKLRDLEHDLPVSELPNGVYGFISAFITDHMLRRRNAGDPNWMQFEFALISPSQGSRLEIHKLQDGALNVVGFSSESDLQLIESPNNDGRVIIYQKPWDEARAITSIPLTRIKSIRERPFRDSTLFELRISASSTPHARTQP